LIRRLQPRLWDFCLKLRKKDAVLAEIDRKEGENYVGRTEFDSPEVDPEVLIPLSTEGVTIGEFYTAEITDASEFDLYAR
jgi:tRNA A37 methylthiotransferase MiaB